MKVFTLLVLLGFIAAAAASSSNPYEGFVNDNKPQRTPGPISLALSAALSDMINSGEYDEIFTAQYGSDFNLPLQGYPKGRSFSDRCGHGAWPSNTADGDDYGRGGSSDHSFKNPYTLHRALARGSINFAIPAAGLVPSKKPVRTGFYYTFALALTRRLESFYGVPLNPLLWEVAGSDFFVDSSKTLYQVNGYDAALGDLIITTKRKTAVDFTCPYAISYLTALRTTLSHDPEIETESDINNEDVTVVTVYGTIAAERAAQLFPNANIIETSAASLSQFAIDNLGHVIFTDSTTAQNILDTNSCIGCSVLDFSYSGTTRYYYAISTPRYFSVNN